MESNRYHVSIAPLADRKLAAHIEFLARVSEQAAIRLYTAYEGVLGFLMDSPKSCPLYIPKKPMDTELRYKLFFDRYRIVFEIIDNAVYAYDIQDCRQGVDNYLV